MRALCITNLFPDTTEPWRGLDNVTLLHAMRAKNPGADIRVLCMRPGHRFWLGGAPTLQPRPGDEIFSPSYHWAPYVPKLGGLNDMFFDWAVRRALGGLPEGWRPDVLLVPWLFPDACGVRRCPDLAGVPMLAVAQGSDVHWYLEMNFRRRAISRLTSGARIITRSEDLRQRLLRLGAAPDGVETVYNGVDVSTFHPGNKATARAELGLPVEGRLALFVGNFVDVKGLDLLVDGLAKAKARLTAPLRLVMIGSGPLEAEILARADESGFGRENIILAGRKAPAEVAHFMRSADVVCLSSHNEGVPNVLFEAFASGRPMVTTDVGGIAEIAGPRPDAGFLVRGRDPGHYADTLLAALASPPDENELADHAARFAWERCAEDYWRNVSICMGRDSRVAN